MNRSTADTAEEDMTRKGSWFAPTSASHILMPLSVRCARRSARRSLGYRHTTERSLSESTNGSVLVAGYALRYTPSQTRAKPKGIDILQFSHQTPERCTGCCPPRLTVSRLSTLCVMPGEIDRRHQLPVWKLAHSSDQECYPA